MRTGTRTTLIGAILFAATGLLLVVMPVLPSVIGDDGYYGQRIDRTGPPLPDMGRDPKHATSGLTVVFFSFRGCGDICPTQIRQMQAVDRLTPDLPLRFAIVTLDPERDTPAAMSEWTRQLGARFDWSRPTSWQAAQALARGYRDQARRAGLDPATNIEHAGHLHVISGDRTQRLIYPASHLDATRVANDLERLSDELTRETRTGAPT